METIIKTCPICGTRFEASTPAAKYCSDQCRTKARRTRVRARYSVHKEEQNLAEKRIRLQTHAFVSISDAAFLLGVSRPTIYKMIDTGRLRVSRISRKVCRISLDDLHSLMGSQVPNLLTLPKTIEKKTEPQHPSQEPQQILISSGEAAKMYSVTKDAIIRRMKSNGIPPIKKGYTYYYPAQAVHQLYHQPTHSDITEWYTMDEIIQNSGIARATVYDLMENHKIPHKKEGKTLYLSKTHWDKLRGNDIEGNPDYYTVPQITEIYGFDRALIYRILFTNEIPREKRGNKIFIPKALFDPIAQRIKSDIQWQQR